MVTMLLFLTFVTSEVRHTESFVSHLLIMLSAWQDFILFLPLDSFYFTFSAENCLGNGETLATVYVVTLSPEPRMCHHRYVKNKFAISTIQSLMTLVSYSQ